MRTSTRLPNEVDELLHDLGGGLAIIPKLAAEIEVTGDSDARIFRRFDRFKRQIRRGLRQRRRYTRDMEPLRAVENFRPVKGTGATFGD